MQSEVQFIIVSNSPRGYIYIYIYYLSQAHSQALLLHCQLSLPWLPLCELQVPQRCLELVWMHAWRLLVHRVWKYLFGYTKCHHRVCFGKLYLLLPPSPPPPIPSTVCKFFTHFPFYGLCGQFHASRRGLQPLPRFLPPLLPRSS